jgi:predicted acetyltransferase
MADVVVRKVQPEEAEAFVHSVRVPFLYPPTGEEDDKAADERRINAIETDRAWVADDRGRFVGNSCIYSLDVTVPAAPGRLSPVVAMAGVSAVGVHPTHRRKGILRRLMVEMIEDARQHGEPVAGLVASESVIYGRFGFGHATDCAETEIDSRESRFAVAAPELEIRLIDKDESAKVLPEMYDRARRSRAGEPSRTAADWEAMIADRPDHRQGHGSLFRALCDDGYVAYRAGDGDIMRAKNVDLIVEEIRASTPEVEAALWRFVLDIDLVGRVIAKRRPVDDPIRWRLSDPRQLHTVSIDDRLYVRMVDTKAALEQRGYRSDGRTVIDVLPESHDDPADPATGRWLLEAGPDGASCRRARRSDKDCLRMKLRDLGSLYMGGVSASSLAAAGRVEELRAGSLLAADALLGTSPAPTTASGF